ncbi:EAL domain-containing protein [Paenibacillus sp. GCM10012307]|uniref:EAL domain-containing protein n=1 Tax=Paenibacillus roseus TaxID=2798579 RepID=A0A934J9Z8_9BACL|nr:EAL domain-containing protein [Paenibacillus roseus]MBJ6363035.1 EAL domain-containing protein [Paenibacillus roseus]
MSKEQTRYSRLANITKLINTNLELREVLSHVVTAISEEIVSCDSVGIYLPQGDGTFKGFVGKPEFINGMTLDMQVINPELDHLAREVIETGKTIYIPDTSVDHRPDQGAIAAFQIKSLLVGPISYEGELFGLIFLFDYGIPMNLNESEIQTVEAYINMAAVAIRNSNELTRKENLIAEKQLLLDVSRDLAMCSSMQEVLDKCFSYISRVMGNSNIGAHFIDPLAGRRIKPARLSKGSDWTEEEWMKTHSKIKIDHSEDKMFQEVIRTKKSVLVPDVMADPRPNHDACRRFGIKGIFMMPMVSIGQVLGTIAVVNLEGKERSYTQASMQLAQSIADTTASVLSNLLYMEKQELIIQERTFELLEKNTELENAVKELQRISREKELILNSAGEGIFGLDREGFITFCNPAAASMLGYDNKESLIDQSYSGIFKRITSFQPGEQPNFASYIENNNTEYDTDEQFFREDGSRFPVEYVVSSIKEDGAIVGYVVTFKDITTRKLMEEKIRYHAYYDSLTNLPNRVLLKDRLNQGLAYAQIHGEKLAVFFLDLDRFKMINDTLGHSYGDLLLEEVARRLSDCVGKGATVSRQGGDEFTIILPSVQNEEEVIVVAERVLEAFSRPFNLNGNEVFIKTSIGISIFPYDGDTEESLIMNADTAMYKSKELTGNNYQFYTSGMDRQTLDGVKFVSALYRAVDHQEFVIYYQPKINYLTGEITGVEALVRWNHPERGMVLPGEFIPIAEEIGLIIPIGEWVLRGACEQLKTWHNLGFKDLDVSVNISARQFEQRNLLHTVNSILEETGLSPGDLELELTENIIIKNTEGTLKTMEQFRESGIKIAIDDFGTGFSSLGYLKRFPITTLKVDRSFLKDVDSDYENTAIATTIITLAQNLKLEVIAEGVENQAQIDFLLSKGCTSMQGYYFGKPQSAEQLTNLLLLGVKTR